MKKLFAAFAAVIMITAAFTSCGKSSASYNLEDLFTAVESSVKIDNPIDFTDDDLQYTAGINKEDVEEYKGKVTNTNGEAGKLLVVKAKAGKADTVKTCLETMRAGDVSYLGNYPEFALAKSIAEAARIVVKGDYIIYAVGGDKAVAEKDGAEKAYEPIDLAISEAFK
ncbi:MAG: DUF4358 domain-containing protein [Oscillospiraceae bacterium]